ncbi:lipoprotein [Comamonas aquatica]|uniref:Lipoprotein n=1 Tax=Comamonas aquatica TaxID=225991 RepID=A0AA42W1J8_9BURK|nr:lipoprotein [Comamonas aquatica]MDE1553899.1 lipoprotein [Comamonas aquatica]MDH0361858.1 lipoprotein [Comamonas aquatica]MDH0494523.1 lipoprotein [Comamonas aquatica]MDH0898820.1 lipoprotein [Comamonas aquatica]MDH1378814.1 lipoprotein [Comamonas aquatica]
MLNAPQILVRCIALAVCTAALAACGQRGPLYLPTDPAAQGRASLPDTVLPNTPAPGTTPPPAPAR